MKTLVISALVVSVFFLAGCITEGGFANVDPNGGYYRYWTGSSYVLVNPNDYYYYYGGSYYHHHYARPIDIVVVRPPVGYRVIQGEPDFSNYHRTHENSSFHSRGDHHGASDWQKPRSVPQHHYSQSLQNRQLAPMARPQHQSEHSSSRQRQYSPRLAPSPNHQPSPRLAPPSTPTRRSAPSIPPKRGVIHSPTLRRK